LELEDQLEWEHQLESELEAKVRVRHVRTYDAAKPQKKGLAASKVWWPQL